MLTDHYNCIPSPLPPGLLSARDFSTLYSYSLDKKDFDLCVTPLRCEEELLCYITHFTVAIFNTRHRSTTSCCLPGVLIAGVTYTTHPGHPNPVTTAAATMTTVSSDDFEDKLHHRLRKCVGCHGSSRLLSDEELSCVKVEFETINNYGNSLFIVYVRPTWEVTEYNLYEGSPSISLPPSPSSLSPSPSLPPLSLPQGLSGISLFLLVSLRVWGEGGRGGVLGERGQWVWPTPL